MIKKGENTVELSPQSAYIRRFQHLVAERHGMYSQSTGKRPQQKSEDFQGFKNQISKFQTNIKYESQNISKYEI